MIGRFQQKPVEVKLISLFSLEVRLKTNKKQSGSFHAVEPSSFGGDLVITRSGGEVEDNRAEFGRYLDRIQGYTPAQCGQDEFLLQLCYDYSDFIDKLRKDTNWLKRNSTTG